MLDPTAPDEGADEKVEPQHAVPSLCDSWSLERLLGSGSQGHVWLARRKAEHATPKYAAVKLLKNCSDARKEVDAYDLLRNFDPHPHVLDAIFGFVDRCSSRHSSHPRAPFPR